MTGEHQQPQETKNTKEKKTGRVRSATKYVAAAAVGGAITAGALFGMNSGGSGETHGQAQSVATNEAPTPATAEASATPRVVENGELPPGFTTKTQVQKGDRLDRINGILTLDVRDPKDGDSAHLTVANPVLRKVNGETQIGVQPVESLLSDGSVDHQAVPGTLAWVSTKSGGAIEGAQVYFSDVIGQNQNYISKVKVLGSTSINTTRPDAHGNYSRTLIEASDSMSANSSQYNQTITGGLDYQTYPQIENKVVATQLDGVVGTTVPPMTYAMPMEQLPYNG